MRQFYIFMFLITEQYNKSIRQAMSHCLLFPFIYCIYTFLALSIINISGKVAHSSHVTLSGKGLANLISKRQEPLLFVLKEW